MDFEFDCDEQNEGTHTTIVSSVLTSSINGTAHTYPPLSFLTIFNPENLPRHATYVWTCLKIGTIILLYSESDEPSQLMKGV